MKKLQNNLNKLRNKAGLKQLDLAEMSKVSSKRISDYETGRIDFTNMTISTAFKLSQALSTTIDELVTAESQPISWKYGIFEASTAISVPGGRDIQSFRLVGDDLWRVVERDENIDKPISVFETKDEALKALENYESQELIYDSYISGKIIEYKVVFVSELELLDDDRVCDLSAYANGDGWAIAPVPEQTHVDLLAFEEEYLDIIDAYVDVSKTDTDTLKKSLKLYEVGLGDDQEGIKLIYDKTDEEDFISDGSDNCDTVVAIVKKDIPFDTSKLEKISVIDSTDKGDITIYDASREEYVTSISGKYELYRSSKSPFGAASGYQGSWLMVFKEI